MPRPAVRSVLRGNDRGVENVLFGTWQRMEVRAFDTGTRKERGPTLQRFRDHVPLVVLDLYGLHANG